MVVKKASKKQKNIGLQKGERNKHPTVKPIELMSYLITMFSREGDVVVDPFMGSGTTGMAAKLLDRKFIGIDLEQKYCQIAKKRIEGLQDEN